MKGLMYRIIAVIVIVSTVLVGCGGEKAKPAKVTSITIEGLDTSYLEFKTHPVKVIAHYEDDTSGSITPVWSTTDDSIAYVDESNTFHAVAPGNVTITAAHESKFASVSLKVTSALTAIAIQNLKSTYIEGQNEQLVVLASFYDDITEQVIPSWNTTDAGIGFVNSDNVFVAVSPGVVEVTASYREVTETLQVSISEAEIVSIQYAVEHTSFPVGTSSQIQGVAILSNEKSVLGEGFTYESLSPTVISVDEQGVAKALSEGEAEIIIRNGEFELSFTLEATPAVLATLTISAPSAIPVGYPFPIDVIGIYTDETVHDIKPTWHVNNESVLRIEDGEIIGMIQGSSDIYATFNDIQSNTLNITINDSVPLRLELSKETLSIPVGHSEQISGTLVFTDNNEVAASPIVFWSDNNEIATVDENGVISGNSIGSTAIVASSYGLTDNVSVDITEALPRSLVLSVDEIKVPHSLQQTFTVLGELSDGTTRNVTEQAVYTLSDPSLGQIYVFKGEAYYTADAPMRGTLTVKYGDLEVEIPVENTDAVPVAFNQPNSEGEFPLGVIFEFAKGVEFSDGSIVYPNEGFTWTVDNPEILNQYSGGAAAIVKFKTYQKGTATITYQYADLIGKAVITVGDPMLTNIRINFSDVKLSDGDYQLTAIAHYSDGTTEDVTDLMTWASEDTSIATVSNEPGKIGLLTPVAVGGVYISATKKNFFSKDWILIE
ncbi:Ig-like domain-containing protein [Thalassotalea mangrovi]|uniref:BIG2 domain-containing protein n=1 Tax=Thalassotalea mangrovi TaxID=2572245 RepID=A0A4U1B4K2_9GAMM|nr:Ig-like domain-containing protein [Thalassotalea mangrovi]TKB45293.1 hypothetical protein E8M12_08805 [Thalassotalea mangrovi]